jgi:hypothetical protein
VEGKTILQLREQHGFPAILRMVGPMKMLVLRGERKGREGNIQGTKVSFRLDVASDR